jgi:hypothetical protein
VWWLVLDFGGDREYAGNVGYEDQSRRLYHYDNSVQNHLRVQIDDVLVVRKQQALIGLGRIAEIQQRADSKVRRRCPVCGITQFRERVTKLPRFRCDDGHKFETPREDSVPCTRFEAYFDQFIDAPGAVSLDQLREACPKYASQVSIQAIDVDAIRWGLCEAAPACAALLPPIAEFPDEAFGEIDERELVTRTIRQRRGQDAFRDALAHRYEERCMISGCRLFRIVDAAHIGPYRRQADHHETNGILLRKDLHGLFDLNLLGIDPETLAVSYHPDVEADGYAFARLQCDGVTPSKSALRARWALFNAGLPQRKSSKAST